MKLATELFMAMLTATFAAFMLLAAQLFTDYRNRSEAAALLWNPASLPQATRVAERWRAASRVPGRLSSSSARKSCASALALPEDGLHITDRPAFAGRDDVNLAADADEGMIADFVINARNNQIGFRPPIERHIEIARKDFPA
jgi:hypothetical protein